MWIRGCPCTSERIYERIHHTQRQHLFQLSKRDIYLSDPFRAGCETRSIFMRSTVGLKSEFTFSQTGCCTKNKEFYLSYYEREREKERERN